MYRLHNRCCNQYCCDDSMNCLNNHNDILLNGMCSKCCNIEHVLNMHTNELNRSYDEHKCNACPLNSENLRHKRTEQISDYTYINSISYSNDIFNSDNKIKINLCNENFDSNKISMDNKIIKYNDDCNVPSFFNSSLCNKKNSKLQELKCLQKKYNNSENLYDKNKRIYPIKNLKSNNEMSYINNKNKTNIKLLHQHGDNTYSFNKHGCYEMNTQKILTGTYDEKDNINISKNKEKCLSTNHVINSTIEIFHNNKNSNNKLKEKTNHFEIKANKTDDIINPIINNNVITNYRNQRKEKNNKSSYEKIKERSSSEIEYNQINDICLYDKKLKRYSLDDIQKGKVEIPEIIFKKLPMHKSTDNLIESYKNNKKLLKFMEDCNKSTSLILKYPEIEKKKGKHRKQQKTYKLPFEYSSFISNKIGSTIIYEDKFDRKNYHPHVKNLHMGKQFEKHVFNILKNKKLMGKKLFSKSNKYKMYKYNNQNGFWISNIDKQRLVCPEKNDSYITELIYIKNDNYDQQMDILKKCEHYDNIIPPIEQFYKNNNFYYFLQKEKIYTGSIQPVIATIMKRYDLKDGHTYKKFPSPEDITIGA
ncbi:conserved Plasmodium protein, unknown function [Plasmodium sp. gorilla clade G2]|uniref:conserved Plasmodium protein, unknown function n=1 Tax=Plasmodium sp. gorilla clade G2 TaxID=880535 RepID=UPI000D209A66|nr:conserved Plasmodium protein, unknown function [Plasmodium sp. gorilla clade G2]SOV17651.1 conserved Plasmodium protein, unknown function [Plasmodium sp. gorilla clade G2]